MANHSVALVLKTKDKGVNPVCTIYVRITVNRKQTFISTGKTVRRDEWDDRAHRVKDHPAEQQYNVAIYGLYNQVLQNVNLHNLESKAFTAKSLKTSFDSKDQHNIFNFVEKYTQDVKSKRGSGTITNYDKHIRKLEEFHGSRNLTFEEIDVEFLNRYEHYLRTLGKLGKTEHGLGNNYVHLLLRALRTFFNAAIKQGIISHYPFRTYEFPTYQAPIKDYLNLSELALWEEFADTTINPVWKQTAVYFLLGCYTGLRISDWQAFSLDKHIVDNRLLLRAMKNKEWVGMEISRPLSRNLIRIKQTPLTIEEPTLNEKLKVIASKLGINKRITSHSGRHTFAITLCADQGVSCETCAELMGITVQTCVDNYYRVTRAKLDRETSNAWKDLK
jgi:site-specific recombinase XerD